MGSLAADHGDAYAAGGYVTRIVEEVRAIGFPAPEGALADATVIGWIDAIAGRSTRSESLPRRVRGRARAPGGMARVRIACAAQESARWQPLLDDVSRIVATMPEHTGLVDGRLSALMEELPVPDWAKGAADAAPTARTGSTSRSWPSGTRYKTGSRITQDDAGKAEVDAVPRPWSLAPAPSAIG